jgi:hypothetical protein
VTQAEAPSTSIVVFDSRVLVGTASALYTGDAALRLYRATIGAGAPGLSAAGRASA